VLFAVILIISLFVTTPLSTCSKHATVSVSQRIHSHEVIEIVVSSTPTLPVNSLLKLFLFASIVYYKF
jgi:predicted CDP-diglyceride synthetase/phosphatidate cytidylyltransferase